MAGINYQTAPPPPPPPNPPRVAVAGRSSWVFLLLNKLFGRKGLVKVSSTPGKTANINFFDVDGIRFVDLPGYGFAKVSQRRSSAGQTSSPATLPRSGASTS